MIDAYAFSKIKINGKTYHSDVIIYPDRVNSSWWRKVGHELGVDDLEDVLDQQPDVIVVGTGDPGLMQVLPETEKLVKSNGIKLIVQPTKEACQTYNRLSSSQKVISMLHLTC
jgi:hypothetical protein